MATDSDPDYNPYLESEDDDKNSEIFSEFEPSRSAKRYKTESDVESDFYSAPNTSSKKTQLVKKFEYDKDTSGPIPKSNGVVFIYHCSFCFYQSPQRYKLKSHIRTCKQENSKKFWECPKCSVKYTLEDLLDECRVLVDRDSFDHHVFHCPICFLESDNNPEDSILEKTHAPNNNLVCPRCKHKINGPHNFIKHMSTEHLLTIKYRCEYCEFCSPGAEALLKHKKSHADLQEMGLINCSHCNADFFTIKEFKYHMSKVQWEREAKQKAKSIEEKDFESFVSSQFDEENLNIEKPMETDSRSVIDTGKWQLKCTLCQYVNYSKASCQRHVKNKHRPFGLSIVKFDKYYEDEFKGSIQIGKVKVEDDEQKSTEKLLKVLDWTQSDEEDIKETTFTGKIASNEVITIQVASDTDESEEELENSELDVQPKKIEISESSKTNYKIEGYDNKEETSADKKTRFRCTDCNYETKSIQHIKIHRQLIHKECNKNMFKCPQRFCKYNSIARQNFRQHLRKAHKYNIESFYPRGLECPDCIYTATKPQFLWMHRRYAHKDLVTKKSSMLTAECEKATPKVRVGQHLGKETENVHEVVKVEQTDVKYSKNTCEYCGAKHKGMYQLAWHMFRSHRDKSELEKWRLKCKQCNYRNTSKLSCYRHGLQHKKRHVWFQKFYGGKLKGSIGFRYLQLQNFSKIDKKVSKKANPSIKKNLNLTDKKEFNKSLDATKTIKQLSDNENNVAKAEDTEKIVDLNRNNEFNDHKGLGSDDDILLEMKAEYFTCARCNYETTHQNYLPLHESLVHGDPVSKIKAKYQCPDCSFESRYRHSLKRHLQNVHQYNVDDFYMSEQASNETRKNKEENKEVEYKEENKEVEYKEENNEVDYREENKKVEYREGNKLDCRSCSYKFQDRYLRDWHEFQSHGKNLTKLNKWKLRCSHCYYQTSSKRIAQTHAAISHSSIKNFVIVEFDKYYKNKFKGSFKFRVPKRVRHCSKCDYVSSSWNNLRQHYRSHSETEVAKSRRQEKLEKEVNLDSVVSLSHHRFDSLVGEEKESEEINFSDETEQGEIIRIEITPDSDDEVNDSQNSCTDLKLEHNEEMALKRQSKEQLEDPGCSKQHETTIKTDINLESDVEGYENEEWLQNDEDNKSDVEVNDTEEWLPNDEDNESNDSSQNLSQDTQDSVEYIEDSLHSNKHNVISITNKCFHRGCKYQSSSKSHLKRHCIRVHKDSEKKLYPIFLNIKQFECPVCKFQTLTRKEMTSHTVEKHKEKSANVFPCQVCNLQCRDRQQRAIHMYRIHRDKTELLKWHLRCTLCSYETNGRKYAYNHVVAKHSSTTQPTVVKFQKFYENEFEGTYTCQYGIRMQLRCNMCDFVADTWECLNRHRRRHRRYKKSGFVPQHQVFNKTAKCVRKGKKMVVETHKAEPLKEGYNKEQILDIIGLTDFNMKENCTLEKVKDKVNEEENRIIAENNEVITSELKPENAESNNKKNEKIGKLNPFTGEFVWESDNDDQLSNEEPAENKTKASLMETKNFKCRQADTHNNSRKEKIITNYTCHLCKEVLTSQNLLQQHSNVHADALSNSELVVSYSELKNDIVSCDIEIKADLGGVKEKSKDQGPKKPAKISYKCWMCGVIVVTKITLKNHTNIHAREDQNFDLKVRYSQFRDDKLEGTVIMHADPNYVSRKKKPAKSPEPEYDSSLPVFCCGECNFKTNEKEALKKHKDLHWTPQKDALFKAQKWFTCSMCFFHCFEVEKFKEHCEWHKTHSLTAGGIGKMGKNSWFLK